MSPSESSMLLIAFLLFTHARLQDNACAMSHDSYVGSNLKCYNPRRACAVRVIVVVVLRVCVCLSVCYHYSGTTGYEAAKERYQRPERYVGIVFKKAIFLKLSYGMKHE